MDIVSHEATEEEDAANRKEIEDIIVAGTAYVKEHGGKSTEGFIRTPEGPKGIS